MSGAEGTESAAEGGAFTPAREQPLKAETSSKTSPANPTSSSSTSPASDSLSALSAARTQQSVSSAPSLIPDMSEAKTSRSSTRTLKDVCKRACVLCKASKVACDNGRPCDRCRKQNRGDECRDAQQKKRGRKRKDTPEQMAASEPLGKKAFMPQPTQPTRPFDTPVSQAAVPSLCPPLDLTVQPQYQQPIVHRPLAQPPPGGKPSGFVQQAPSALGAIESSPMRNPMLLAAMPTIPMPAYSASSPLAPTPVDFSRSPFSHHQSLPALFQHSLSPEHLHMQLPSMLPLNYSSVIPVSAHQLPFATTAPFSVPAPQFSAAAMAQQHLQQQPQQALQAQGVTSWNMMSMSPSPAMPPFAPAGAGLNQLSSFGVAPLPTAVAPLANPVPMVLDPLTMWNAQHNRIMTSSMPANSNWLPGPDAGSPVPMMPTTRTVSMVNTVAVNSHPGSPATFVAGMASFQHSSPGIPPLAAGGPSSSASVTSEHLLPASVGSSMPLMPLSLTSHSPPPLQLGPEITANGVSKAPPKPTDSTNGRDTSQSSVPFRH